MGNWDGSCLLTFSFTIPVLVYPFRLNVPRQLQRMPVLQLVPARIAAIAPVVANVSAQVTSILSQLTPVAK